MSLKSTVPLGPPCSPPQSVGRGSPPGSRLVPRCFHTAPAPLSALVWSVDCLCPLVNTLVASNDKQDAISAERISLQAPDHPACETAAKTPSRSKERVPPDSTHPEQLDCTPAVLKAVNHALLLRQAVCGALHAGLYVDGCFLIQARTSVNKRGKPLRLHNGQGRGRALWSRPSLGRPHPAWTQPSPGCRRHLGVTQQVDGHSRTLLFRMKINISPRGKVRGSSKRTGHGEKAQSSLSKASRHRQPRRTRVTSFPHRAHASGSGVPWLGREVPRPPGCTQLAPGRPHPADRSRLTPVGAAENKGQGRGTGAEATQKPREDSRRRGPGPQRKPGPCPCRRRRRLARRRLSRPQPAAENGRRCARTPGSPFHPHYLPCRPGLTDGADRGHSQPCNHPHSTIPRSGLRDAARPSAVPGPGRRGRGGAAQGRSAGPSV